MSYQKSNNHPMNPLKQLEVFWKKAQREKSGTADYFSLATVDLLGHPKVRTVLIKILDQRGIGFVTNKTSPKVNQFQKSKRVAGLIAWPELALQVRIEGSVVKMPQKEISQFWTLRSREAQLLYSLGLKQSQEISSFEYLKAEVGKLGKKWGVSVKISLAPNYTGYIIRPTLIEFLHHSPSRMNLRECFQKKSGRWQKQILAP